MATRQQRESKSTYFLCFVVVVLSFATLRAEDLTTMDGKTYTNVTDIAKYPNQIVFTFNDKRTPVAISNLPAEFRAKHGIKEVEKKAAPVVDPTNLLLAQNRNLDLTAEKRVDDIATAKGDTTHSWVVRVTPKGFELTGYRWSWVTTASGSKEHKNTHWTNLEFVFGEEKAIKGIFDKFLEWESIASTNRSEPFEKKIASYGTGRIQIDGSPVRITRTFSFQWSSYGASLSHSPTLLDPPEINTTVYSIDVPRFRELLASIPTLKEELAQKIRNKDSQKGLFK